jgi:4-nitrophenol 2-monooxygenase / 4-nitrocatechol 4-monooxygenase, reductase component
MPFDPNEFRRVMGHWVSGVAVIGSRRADGTAVGLTASAVSSLSLEPPLLLVCVALSAETHDGIREAGNFSVSVLADDQPALARHFSRKAGERGKFDGVPHRSAPTGAPILEGVLAWADCVLHASHPGGDHTIFVGEVVAADARDGRPLLHFRGSFGTL